MTDHPMQPSPLQFAAWLTVACRLHPSGRAGDIAGHVARLAYAAGADAELEKVGSEIVDGVARIYLDSTKDRVLLASAIRDARRPKPPSLKQQALDELEEATQYAANNGTRIYTDTIRRAIEALPEETDA